MCHSTLCSINRERTTTGFSTNCRFINPGLNYVFAFIRMYFNIQSLPYLLLLLLTVLVRDSQTEENSEGKVLLWTYPYIGKNSECVSPLEANKTIWGIDANVSKMKLNKSSLLRSILMKITSS
jgi:hypothetical protein